MLAINTFILSEIHYGVHGIIPAIARALTDISQTDIESKPE